MGLATYRRCTFSEKRAVLRTFWSHHDHESDKVLEAAREYGPYALAMVAIITVEFAFIFAVLLADANPWAWLGAACTLAGAASTWWTGVCRRAIGAPLRTVLPEGTLEAPGPRGR